MHVIETGAAEAARSSKEDKAMQRAIMTETDVMMKESKNSMARYYLDSDTSWLTLHLPLTFSFSLPPSFNLTKNNDELRIATSSSCISYATESSDIGASILHWCDYLQSAFI